MPRKPIVLPGWLTGGWLGNVILTIAAFLEGVAVEQRREQQARQQAEKTVEAEQAEAAAKDHAEIQQEVDQWRLPKS